MTLELMLEKSFLGPQSAGLLMTPEEFDAIEDFDESCRYELVHGVLVVTPIPLPEETDPNDLLGYLLRLYKVTHPQGKALDHSLPQQYVNTDTGRRIADRLIWAGLGRLPNIRKDLPRIAVEFVSGSRRDWQRDYMDKKQEYAATGIAEYWIFDRFQRTLTVILIKPTGLEELVIAENEAYESSFLPGFRVPLAELLAAADQWQGLKDE